MKFLPIFVTTILALGQLSFAPRGAAPKVANPVVIQFMVDGIDHNSVRTAIAAGENRRPISFLSPG